MNLDTAKWKPFYLKKLFSIQMGNKFDKNKLNEDVKDVNFVSRISYNNGVDTKVALVDGVEPFEAGLVTVALGGSYLGSCFVQEEPFYTAQNIAVMRAIDNNISRKVCMFISALVRFECKIKYYAFGRELNTHINNDFDIELPILYDDDYNPKFDFNRKYSDDGYIPDWKYMEYYIDSLNLHPITTKNKNNICAFDVSIWQEYKIGSVFPKKEVKHYSSTPEEIGNYPFVSSKAVNNGVKGKVDEPPINGNCITISTNGSCFDCFYHPDKIVVSNDVEVLYNPNLNVYNAMFIITIMMLEKSKYSYGRKPKNGKVYDTFIKLPSILTGSKKYNIDGYEPDWKYMEKYIKSLPYGDRLEK